MEKGDSQSRVSTAAVTTARTKSSISKRLVHHSQSAQSLFSAKTLSSTQIQDSHVVLRAPWTAAGSSMKEKSFFARPGLKLNPSSDDVFPGWLNARKDFQEIRSQYLLVDFIDVFSVCLKVASLRTDFERQAVVKFLKSCPFFSSMKDPQLRNISERMHAVHFRNGQRLIAKGEKADCLYMIVTGRVGIYINSDKPIDEVIERNVVGEAAIHSRSIRTATVVAHTDVKTLKLTYEDYDIVAFKIKLLDFNAVSGFLRSMEYFADWNLSKLYRLASIVIVKQYEKNQVLYTVGETAHDLFVIREGEVAIKVEIEVEKRNRWPSFTGQSEVHIRSSFEKTLRVCSSGDFFGEQELISRIPRRATALCTTTSCILFLIRDDYFREIFSDRDQKALFSRIQQRPESGELRRELVKERHRAMISTDAILDGMNINNIPDGRAIFYGASNSKQRGIAKVLVNRKKRAMRRNLVRQIKTQREIVGRFPVTPVNNLLDR